MDISHALEARSEEVPIPPLDTLPKGLLLILVLEVLDGTFAAAEDVLLSGIYGIGAMSCLNELLKSCLFKLFSESG